MWRARSRWPSPSTRPRCRPSLPVRQFALRATRPHAHAAEADAARGAATKASTEHAASSTELSNLKRDHEVDLGDSLEYAPLQGQCFELLDRECACVANTAPLTRADTSIACVPSTRSRRSPRRAGAPPHSGMWRAYVTHNHRSSNWKRWDAVDDSAHGAMVFENGERCWNGPDRSMKVWGRHGRVWVTGAGDGAVRPGQRAAERRRAQPLRVQHDVRRRPPQPPAHLAPGSSRPLPAPNPARTTSCSGAAPCLASALSRWTRDPTSTLASIRARARSWHPLWRHSAASDSST